MAEPNYSRYLKSVYPGTSWTVSRLTGGIVNSTLRAVKTSGDAGPNSLVIKHAHPYIEISGPGAVFSTKRQLVEATLLQLWDRGGILSDLRRCAWDTPCLLRHEEGNETSLGLSNSDQEASILLLSDLGDLVNMVQFIKACAKDITIASDGQLAALGRDIGGIMARIHSDATLKAIKSVPDTYNKLTSTLTTDIVREVAVEPIRDRIKHHPDADRLYQQVLDEYTSPKHTYRHALSLGDFHPGSVLMRQPTVGGSLTPILVDWEFGTVKGRGVNGDIAQFLASFHCELIGAKDDEALYKLLSIFLKNFCAAYRDGSSFIVTKSAEDSNVQLLRSAFSLHGREMINLANDEHSKHPRFQEMVDTGVWYLERVGEDAREFVANSNWALLENEHEHLIRSLFVLP